MKQELVITGMGAVTPIGGTVESFWEANLVGKSGLGREEQMDLSDLPCGWIIGTVPTELKQAAVNRWSRPGNSMGESLMREAAEQALEDAHYEKPLRSRAGLVWLKSCPSSGSCPEEYEAHMRIQAERYQAAGEDPIALVDYIRSQSAAPSLGDHSSFPALMSKRMDVPLLATRLEATCAGGVRAIVEAARLLHLGEVDLVVVAAGVIRRNHYVLSQYAQLMALSRWDGPAAQASMPFDKRRSGMVISEAAGALVIETAAHAAARGVRQVHAKLGGWGLSVSTAHVTAPKVEMVEHVIRSALANSGLKPEAVDAINAHGTSTKLNDVTEARALHNVFGARMAELDVMAVKSLTGHGSGASGIIETIVSALALCRGIIPPIVTCTEPDPECNVKTNLTPVSRPVATIVKNSFGFGGQYASLILKRPENPRPVPAQPTPTDATATSSPS